MFISETKLYQFQYVSWRKNFHFKGIFSVDCKGRKGGLDLLWNDPYDSNSLSRMDILTALLGMSNLFGGLQVSTAVTILQLELFLGNFLVGYIIFISFKIFHG